MASSSQGAEDEGMAAMISRSSAVGRRSSGGKGALSHIRIIELGQVIAGTYGDMILADLGAEVIKVEPPRGDLGRNPHIAYMQGESAIYVTMNRGKKSVVVDLKQDRGLEVFYDLVRHSDVVVDNFRPGVVERMRIDYQTLSSINPRVVCCSITGFGSKGPNRDVPSFDLIHQAMSGHLSITGEPGGKPVRVGVPLGDLGAAMFAVQAILAALVARERTGRGQRIELSMFETMTFLLTYDATMYLNTGVVPRGWGTGHAYHVPWQAFETRDGWLVVATREEVFWKKFCSAIGRPDLAEDPRYARNLDRLENRTELVPLLEARLRERSTAEWLAIFKAEEVPAAPVNDLGQALADPTLAENNGIVDVPYAPLGSVRMLANPIRLSDTPIQTYGSPPLLGEHTRQVLAEVARYPSKTIDDLERDRVVIATPDSRRSQTLE
jgi:crotonobetainyl-CoA:carnitine CoA-transferase CaiB-like acyl-CoA transferase